MVNTSGPRVALSNPMTQTVNYIQTTGTASLMEKVVERNNMKEALKRVLSNKGAPGIDGMKVTELLPYLNKEWDRIKQELLSGTYKPTLVRRVEIPKRDGGVRLLGIPTALDRLIQQAIQQILTPIFEPGFLGVSYGFRKGKNAQQAVRKAQQYIKAGYTHVVDIDLEKFFDRVNHDILMTKVYERIKDVRILKTIRRYLQSGVMINGCCVTTEEGTPQGGPMSPLLANIMLNDLDHELVERGHKVVRYADDCNIYTKSERAARRVYENTKKYIEKQLKLKVNVEKSAVDRPWKRKFLGFSFLFCKEKKIRLSLGTITRFKDKIRELTNRSMGESLDQKLLKLNEYLMGWSGYFRMAQTKSIFAGLDEWIRRRLRMCLIKQWKRCITKLRNLKTLGISEEWAKLVAFSRKGYWRLSIAPQLSKALGNKYWKDRGLVSLVERYQMGLTL